MEWQGSIDEAKGFGMNKKKLIMQIIVAVAVLFFVQLAIAKAAGYESLFQEPLLSRGMMMYFIAFPLLLAMPYLNKTLKTFVIYILLFSLSRGIMRVTDEQDPIKVIASMPQGIVLGVLIVVPFVLAMLAWNFLKSYSGKASLSVELSDLEIKDYLNLAQRKGFDAGQLRNELQKEGIPEKEIARVVEKFMKGKAG